MSSSRHQNRQILPILMGLVLALTVVAVASSPVGSTSDSARSQQQLFDKNSVPRYRWAFQQPSDELLNSLRERILLVRPMPRYPFTSVDSAAVAPAVKRMQCISGLPGGDCENSFLGGESLGQDFLRPGGRNPGRR